MAAQKYKVRSIAWERLEVTSALDANPDQRAMEIVKPYKARVDSTMMPVLGLSRVAMAAGRPESAGQLGGRRTGGGKHRHRTGAGRHGTDERGRTAQQHARGGGATR